MNRCDICRKFRKDEEVEKWQQNYGPFLGGEDIIEDFTQCLDCSRLLGAKSLKEIRANDAV